MQQAGGRRTFSSTPDEGRSSTSPTTGGEEGHIFNIVTSDPDQLQQRLVPRPRLREVDDAVRRSRASKSRCSSVRMPALSVRGSRESASVPRRQRLAVRLGGGEPARLLLGRGGRIEQRLPLVEQAGVGARAETAHGARAPGSTVLSADVPMFY